MYLVSHYSMTKAKMVHDDLHVNVKYNEWKISGSQSVAIAVQMALSVIAVRQLIFQFSIEKQYPNRVYQIETFFSEENWLIFVEFKGKDAWESKILSVPTTEKIRTVKQTFTHGSNLVVINHSHPISVILNFFLKQDIITLGTRLSQVLQI